MAEVIARHLVMRGRVQGVYYRESMRQQAERLAVVGWVRNRNDGTVEALLQGEAQAVAALIDWSRHGPPAAAVESVEIELAELGPHMEFARHPTL